MLDREFLLIHSLCRLILSICWRIRPVQDTWEVQRWVKLSLLWGSNQGLGMAGRGVSSTWEGKNKVLGVQRSESSCENQRIRGCRMFIECHSFVPETVSGGRMDINAYCLLLSLPDTVLQDFTYIIWCKIINRQCRRKDYKLDYATNLNLNPSTDISLMWELL